MNTPASRIVALRQSQGLTQESFGDVIGYSRTYISDIEMGKTPPSRRFLEAVSKKFGVSIDGLLANSKILELIDYNKGTDDPQIIFCYAFSQEGLREYEDYLKELLEPEKTRFVDASVFKTATEFLNAIADSAAKSPGKAYDKVRDLVLTEDLRLVLKGLSTSRVSKAVNLVYDIFKTMDDAWLKQIKAQPGGEEVLRPVKSSIIILDYPSFLENNYKLLGYYSVPVPIEIG